MYYKTTIISGDVNTFKKKTLKLAEFEPIPQFALFLPKIDSTSTAQRWKKIEMDKCIRESIDDA